MKKVYLYSFFYIFDDFCQVYLYHLYLFMKGGGSMFNEVILIGKLVDKPFLRETQQGVKLATIVLQIERPYRNNLGIRENDYVNCILWKSMASQVTDCCEIGSFLGVKGRLQSRTYENSDNQSVSSMEVKVEHVEILDKYFFKK